MNIWLVCAVGPDVSPPRERAWECCEERGEPLRAAEEGRGSPPHMVPRDMQGALPAALVGRAASLATCVDAVFTFVE